jgi:hypothetical protein
VSPEPRSSASTDPFLTATRWPKCARMKSCTHTVPCSQLTWTSARNSPSRVNADSNQPVAPPGKASRTAIARSATAPEEDSPDKDNGSATAAVTEGSPGPSSRRQSIA